MSSLTLRQKGIEVGRELFYEVQEETERKYVGATGEKDFEFEGKTYSVQIDAYWEKGGHFDFHIYGNGANEKGLELI